ncbi:hypothetical protein UFOVP1382_128 [uncultured Caudovirales phage]|uniref:Uncharacterized protein n=1 Tax=uncultured Caudovirales phage TaxID=2100421 RepID=A0A6J5S4J6_9CAUD|nr:hypothetical protein UFOVP1382_128 [uncultured Caudovirales phage]
MTPMRAAFTSVLLMLAVGLVGTALSGTKAQAQSLELCQCACPPVGWVLVPDMLATPAPVMRAAPEDRSHAADAMEALDRAEKVLRDGPEE